jgi:uncharacterized phage protein (TIGR01671 family)
MNTIKFRAWDKIDKKIKEVSCINWFDELVTMDEHPNGEYIIRNMSEVELMQYVGLIDKNGNPIFEGDTVKTNAKVHSDCEVVFHQGVFGIIAGDGRHYPLREFSKTGTSISEMSIDLEVIGTKIII